MTTWILVADSGKATLFHYDKPNAALVELRSLTHPDSRKANRELSDSAPGRAFDSYGTGRHAMGKEAQGKEREAEKFAAELGELLNKGAHTQAFHKLYIVAAPGFLGRLRTHLDHQTQALVVAEISKNLVGHQPQDIRSHLPKYL